MILITNGCSFTTSYWENESVKNWPHWLQKKLNCELINLAIDGQGNDLIVKQTIYKIANLINDGVNLENILVGIMWTSLSRINFFSSFEHGKQIKLDKSHDNGGYILLPNKKNERLTQLYHKNFYDNINGQINTLQNILTLQLFLEKNNIKYFMTTYTNFVLSEYIKEIHCEWLYNLINLDYFIPIDGCYEWCKDFSNLPFYEYESEKPVKHPTEDQHKIFVDHVILPFLQNKNLINGAQRED